MVRRVIYILILMLSYITLTAKEKYALTVFISEYPKESGWNSLNSSNDKTIIISALESLGYKHGNIICLEDSHATYEAIIKSFSQLGSLLNKGDEVYIHFSCHGQQITDLNRDETSLNPKDKYDEALVPYDAYIAYGWNGYKGDKHLIDDEINDWLNQISTRVGKEGIVIYVADACHSGDSFRTVSDINYVGHRGTFDRFELPLPTIKESRERCDNNWVSISACKEFETNFECVAHGERYGRLSYSISRCMSKGITVKDLISAIRDEYTRLKLPKGKAQTLDVACPNKMEERVLFR